MSYARVPVSISHHHRIMGVRPEAVRIPLGIRSETDGAETEACKRIARAAALGVWTAALCYTRQHGLDGFCPLVAIDGFALTDIVDELVRQGLLTRAERDGRPGVVVVSRSASRRCR
jgi:hypothetical protein